MKRSKLLWFALIGLLTISAEGQVPVLNLQEVVAKAIEENHQLKASGYIKDIAENSADPGLAGLYPRIVVSGNSSMSENDTRLEFAQAGQPPVEVSGAQSFSYGAGVALNYRLFDGLGNVYTLRQLNSEAEIGALDYRIALENTMTATIVQFFNMARLQEQRNIEEDNLNISFRRYERALIKGQMGSGSSFELSSSEVDLRNDSLSWVQSGVELDNARRALNTLMGQDQGYVFQVNAEVIFANLQTDSVLFKMLEENNSSNLRARSTEKAQSYARKVAGSAFLPTLDFQAGYNYSGQENEVGLLLFQQNTGVNAGVNLQWDLFNGKVNYIRNQNARLALEQSRELKEQQELQSRQELKDALELYRQALYAVDIARRNVKTSELNFERAQNLFSLGQIDNTQFREAQLNLQNSISGRNNALFTAKVAETEVLRLSGQLVGN